MSIKQQSCVEAMKQALEHVQEFKRRWFAVPPFGNKVNKATREAVTLTHVPVFQIEDTLRQAIARAEGTLEAEKQEHGSPEDMYVEMHKHLNCPSCGGSGHIDDVQKREPLTDEEIEKMRHLIDWTAHWSYITFARAIEAAHGIIKNYPEKDNSKREWVGLTNDQKLSLEIQGGKTDVMLAEMVEKWLKEMNT